MAITQEAQDRYDSELANMEIAYQQGFEKLVELRDSQVAVPGLAAVVNKLLLELTEREPAATILLAMNPMLVQHFRVQLMHAFMTGQVWGKANRELFVMTPEEGCNDPEHEHYVPPKENDAHDKRD